MTGEELTMLVEQLDRASDQASGYRFRLLVQLREMLLTLEAGGFLLYMPFEALRRACAACSQAFGSGVSRLEAIRLFRSALFLPGSMEGMRSEKMDCLQTRKAADYLTVCLKCFLEGWDTVSRLHELSGEDLEEEEKNWKAEEQLLREKLDRLLTVYEMKSREDIQRRRLREIEEMQEMTGSTDVQDAQSEILRLEEEQHLLAEKIRLLKNVSVSERTFESPDGCKEWIHSYSGKEEEFDGSDRHEEPERKPEAESAD